MCLITEQKEALIAENDIEIWKTMIEEKGKLISPYRYFTYNFNELYEVEMIADNNPKTYADDIVGHAYNFFDYDSYDSNFMKIAKELTNVHRGFHSIFEKERIGSFKLNYNIIVKGIIPTGSLYYKDKTGLIVSNKIILIEKINEF